jgi:hypothetical protein
MSWTEQLLEQLTFYWEHQARSRLDGLTDDEYFWEPVPGAWSIRPRAEARTSLAAGGGDLVIDFEHPEPVPAPFTTIAWRLVHAAECKVMYHEYAFGPGRLTWPDIDSAHTAADAIAQLDEGHGLLAADLAGLDDDELERPRATNWGEDWPTWKIFWTMIHHDIHHGAEIGALRDLHRLTRGAIGSEAGNP